MLQILLVIKSESPYLLAEQQVVLYQCKTSFLHWMGKQITPSQTIKKKSKTKSYCFTEPLHKINSLKVLKHLLGHHTML